MDLSIDTWIRTIVFDHVYEECFLWCDHDPLTCYRRRYNRLCFHLTWKAFFILQQYKMCVCVCVLFCLRVKFNLAFIPLTVGTTNIY